MSTSSHPRIPALDGLRGLAVAGVVAFHAGFGWARGGFLGVSLFFTLSGFLICSLLVAERDDEGRVDLRRFWARRARRLLPAAIMTLLGVVLFGATGSSDGQLRDLPGDVLAALGYVANWRFVLDDAGYLDLGAGPSPVQHFWSLAIEEQFYVLFPLVVVVARRRLVPVLATGIALSLLSLAVIDDPLRAYYGTDARAAELLVGALLALLVRPAPARAGRLATGAGTVALGLVLWAWASVATTDETLYAGGFALHAVLVGVVIWCVRSAGPLATALSIPPLRWLGRISYGAYLYHWPLFLWLTPQRTGLDGIGLAGLRLAATLLVADVSCRLLEEPIRSGRRVSTRLARPAVAVGGAAVVLAAVVVTPAPDADDPLLLLATGSPALLAPPAEVTTGARPEPAVQLPSGPERHAVPWSAGEPLRVYVAGDSNAMLLGVALAKWAAGRDVEVWTSGWFACHLVRGGAYRFAAEPPKATDPKCNGWVETRGEELARIRPHVTVVHVGAFDVLDRRLPGSDTWRHVGQRGYASLLRREVARMTDLAQDVGSRVLWATYPAIEAGRVEGVPPAERHPENDVTRIERLNGIFRRVADERPGVGILEVRRWYQTWPGGELDPVHRRDGLHPSRERLSELAAWVGPQLVERARRP